MKIFKIIATLVGCVIAPVVSVFYHTVLMLC